MFQSILSQLPKSLPSPKSLLQQLQPHTKQYKERRIIQTPPKHLLQIISDVDSYQQFLPLCTSSKILQRRLQQQQQLMNGTTKFEATLTIGLPPLFTETYTSVVTVDHFNLEVVAKSIDGMTKFGSLCSRWKLRSIIPPVSNTTANEHDGSNNNKKWRKQNEAITEHVFHNTTKKSAAAAADCKKPLQGMEWSDVDFQVEMTVRDPLIAVTLDRVLKEVAGRQIEAFERRCREVACH